MIDDKHYSEKVEDAINMAIKALKQKPREDYISRQQAINALGEVHPLDYNTQAIKAKIEQLPSVQPRGCVETYKFCPNCGTATNGMKFCGECGFKLA